MRVLLAPDSFKECLSATAVAEAMAAGVRQAAPQAEIDLCPMADGGEGTVEAMVRAGAGEFRWTAAVGPLGESRQARFGLLGGGDAAVIEMAEAAGLALVPPDRRDPSRTTTFGVGQLIRSALDAGAGHLVVGIGGSATNDGGAGCAQALGVVFIRRDGRPFTCGLTGGDLAEIGSVDASDRDARLSRSRIRVACDVSNPLTGPTGAACVYAPQKGATPAMVRRLDEGLVNLAAVIRRDLKMEVEDLPGAGAAGGLGAGLVAFAGAELLPGVGVVAQAVDLPRRICRADLVITGEGKLDAQSAAGKTAAGVARLAAEADRPVICICGQAAPDAPGELFRAVYPLVAVAVTVERALADAVALLTERTRQALAEIGHG